MRHATVEKGIHERAPRVHDVERVHNGGIGISWFIRDESISIHGVSHLHDYIMGILRVGHPFFREKNLNL